MTSNQESVHIDIERMLEEIFEISLNEYWKLSEPDKQKVSYFLLSTLNQELIRNRLYKPIYKDLFALAQYEFEIREEYEKSDILARAKNMLENI